MIAIKSVLSRQTKLLLRRVLTDFFNKDPNYNSKIKIVNKRSDLEEFRYGIIFRNFNANPMLLAADHYIGEIYSYTSIAKVGYNPSMFLDYVQEDYSNLFRKVVDEDLTSQVDGITKVFSVEYKPVVTLDSKNEISITNDVTSILVKIDGQVVTPTFLKGREGTFGLDKPVLVGEKLTVSYVARKLAPAGYYYLEMVAPNQVMLGTFLAAERFKIDTYNYGCIFKFNPGVLNQGVSVFVDNTEFTEGVEIEPAGNYIKFERRPIGTDLEIRYSSSGIPLVAGQDYYYLLLRKQTLLDNSNTTPSFIILSETPYANFNLFKNGRKLKPYTSGSTTWDYKLVGNRIEFFKPVEKFATIYTEYQYQSSAVETQVNISNVFDYLTIVDLPTIELVPDFFELYDRNTMLPTDTFTVDYTQGILTLLKIPIPNNSFEVSYRWSVGTTGPYTVEKNSSYNNIIPGVILHFGSKFAVKDKLVVLVGENRKVCADEYGGRYEVEVDLNVITPNPMEAELLADLVQECLWSENKVYLDYIGFHLRNVSPSGESEEVIDESTGDTDAQVSINVSATADWFRRVPRPFRLKSINGSTTPYISDEQMEGIVSSKFDINGIPYFNPNPERHF